MDNGEEAGSRRLGVGEACVLYSYMSGNRQSAIGNRLSAIVYRQSAIGYRQSAIGNRLFAISYRLRSPAQP